MVVFGVLRQNVHFGPDLGAISEKSVHFDKTVFLPKTVVILPKTVVFTVNGGLTRSSGWEWEVLH